MITSTTKVNKSNKFNKANKPNTQKKQNKYIDKKTLYLIIAAFFWLVVWQIVSDAVNKPIILVSPADVLKRLCEIVFEESFRASVWFSFVRIAGGFFLSLFCGAVFAVISSFVPLFRILLSPLNAVVKATPVASFIILVLLWVPSRNLSFIISFLMSFPVIYSNILNGMMNVSGELIEMARIFRIPFRKRFLYIYLPDVMPFVISACNIAVGLCFKSGIAAEVIGLPKGSIGDMLYRAKIYLETADLFAWTVTIIIISSLFERLFLYILKIISKLIDRGGVKTVIR